MTIVLADPFSTINYPLDYCQYSFKQSDTRTYLGVVPSRGDYFHGQMTAEDSEIVPGIPGLIIASLNCSGMEYCPGKKSTCHQVKCDKAFCSSSMGCYYPIKTGISLRLTSYNDMVSVFGFTLVNGLGSPCFFGENEEIKELALMCKVDNFAHKASSKEKRHLMKEYFTNMLQQNGAIELLCSDVIATLRDACEISLKSYAGRRGE
ncbi:MAG: hypothetical protein ACR2PT_21820 [Endozoicomonas sp.]